MIHVVQPFGWDPPLSALDARVHLGHFPWRILQPALGHPPITRMLDFAYVPVLLALLVGVTVWQGWTTDTALRRRFLLTFVLAWILLGTGLAVALLLGRSLLLRPSDRTARPVRRPHGVPERRASGDPAHRALIQDALWQSHVGNMAGSFSEISAMPSIHVAMPMLFALAGWRAYRRLGWALAAFGGRHLLARSRWAGTTRSTATSAPRASRRSGWLCGR